MAATILSPTPLAQLRIDASCPAPGTVRVAVAGEIDLSTADVLRAELLRALSARLPHRMEVDLAGVTFMDCGGLTVLVVAGKAAARTGCRLQITNPQPIVRRVLDLTGLLGVLTARFDQTPPGATGPASPIGPTSGNVTQPATLLAAA
jgi:anti-anti-sigma factor